MEKNETIAETMNNLYRECYRNAAKVIITGGNDFIDYGVFEYKTETTSVR